MHMLIVLAQTTLPSSSTDFLIKIVTGMLVGMLGQGARVAVGMKKTFDEAEARKTSFAQQFNWGQLVVSLFLGAIAGAIAIFSAVKQFDTQAFTTLFAAGYAGSDFIEGFIRNEAAVQPKASGSATSQQVQKLTALTLGLK